MAGSREEITVSAFIIGARNVGKNALLAREIENTFSPYSLPIDSFRSKTYILKDDAQDEGIKRVIANFYKTPRSKGTLYSTDRWRSVDVFYAVYDINSRSSFSHITEEFLPAFRNSYSTGKIVLIGTKIDEDEAKRVVSSEEGRKLAEDHGMLFFEVSAKTGANVNLAFQKSMVDTASHKKSKQRQNAAELRANIPRLSRLNWILSQIGSAAVAVIAAIVWPFRKLYEGACWLGNKILVFLTTKSNAAVRAEHNNIRQQADDAIVKQRQAQLALLKLQQQQAQPPQYVPPVAAQEQQDARQADDLPPPYDEKAEEVRNLLERSRRR